MDDLRHQLIKGRYHLNRMLGMGGMATVYLADDRLIKRQVVVKVLPTDEQGGHDAQTVKAQFLQEARTLASLDHPNIIRIFDFGQFHEQPFMVMEYLPNSSLSRRMAEFQDHQKAALLLAQIADALQYAHKRGLVHRDVKPDNIVFARDDTPRLSDFGIVALLPRIEVEPLFERESEAVVLSGTPQYMAPELWHGQVLPQSDQYALGVMFYELLTGEWPYMGTSPWDYGDQHLEAAIPSVRQVVPWLPREVGGVIRRMMAKNPQDRFSDMAVVADTLRALAKIPLSPQQIARAKLRKKRRKKMPWWQLLLIGVFWLVVVSILAVLVLG